MLTLLAIECFLNFQIMNGIRASPITFVSVAKPTPIPAFTLSSRKIHSTEYAKRGKYKFSLIHTNEYVSESGANAVIAETINAFFSSKNILAISNTGKIRREERIAFTANPSIYRKFTSAITVSGESMRG